MTLSESENNCAYANSPNGDSKKYWKSPTEEEHQMNGVVADLRTNSCNGGENGGCERPLMENGGPRGAVLTRQNTFVPGCSNCNGGGKLISCARVKNWTPVLCWDRTSKRPSLIVITLLSVLSLLSFIGIVIICFTNTFNNSILTNLVISKESPSFEMWKNPPVQPLMKVYILNYTNIEEYSNRKEPKLRVEDIGPYVYRETIKRVNEVFHPNGTVTFQMKYSYQFIAELSTGNQYDKVTVPNLPLISAMSMAKDSGYYLAQVGLSTLFKTLRSKPFRTLPLHRFLWGYEDELIYLAKPILKLKGDMPVFDKFGILVTKNGTLKDRVTIYTGEKDINKIGVIDKYNGLSQLPHWGTEECNKVDATDGTIFPASMVDGSKTLYIFNRDLCRRYPFVFNKKVEIYKGIPAWRYKPPLNVFDDPSTSPENQCYCHMDSGTCPPKGVFNSSPCAFGAPAFASFPHFYLGDPKLLDTIDGLHPDPEKHDTYLDIHPGLGFPIAASSKMQINVQIRRSKGIPDFGFLPDNLLLPIAWLDVTVTELPQEIKTLLYHGTFSAHQVELILMWTCIITFIITFFFLVMALRVIWSKDVPQVFEDLFPR